MTLLLVGQLVSGKNAVRTTRTGQHYPQPRFTAWRHDAVLQLKAQRLIPRQPIEVPVRMRVEYTAGDKRVRDISGMLDGLFHLLVYAGILKDDGLVRDVIWGWQGVNTQYPRTLVELSVWG